MASWNSGWYLILTIVQDHVGALLTANRPAKLQTYVAIPQVIQTLCSRFNLGSVPAVIRSAKLVNDGQEHEVTIIREDNRGSVQVDGGPIVPGFTRGEGVRMKVRRTPIFLAGAPSTSLFLPSQATLYKTAFKGCILKMKVWNNKVKVNK